MYSRTRQVSAELLLRKPLMSKIDPLDAEATSSIYEPLTDLQLKTLEDQFRERCVALTDVLREFLGKPRTIFLRMMSDHGAVRATKRIIHSDEPSSTFADLYLKGHGARHLNMTLEAIITTEREWDPLFTDVDREAAGKRLRDHEWLDA